MPRRLPRSYVSTCWICGEPVRAGNGTTVTELQTIAGHDAEVEHRVHRGDCRRRALARLQGARA